MKKTFERIRAEISKLNVFVYEHILGIHIVKIFNQQKNEQEKFININKDYTNYNIKSVLYFSIFLPVIDIFSAISKNLSYSLSSIETVILGSLKFLSRVS